MTITYEITPEDLRFISSESAKATALHTIYTVISALILVLFVFSDIILVIVAPVENERFRIESLHVLPRLIIATVLLCMMYFAGKALSRRAVKKALGSPGKNGIFCEHSIISLDSDGFTETTEVNRSFYAWTGVDRVGETDSFVTLTLRLGTTYYIPKRYFPNRKAVMDFLMTAESYLPESSRKLSNSTAANH